MFSAKSPARRAAALFGTGRLWLVHGVVLLLLSPWAAHLLGGPVEFNQFLIQQLEARHGVIAPRDALRTLRSAYASGLNILWNRPARTPPDVADAHAMFAFIYSWVPGYAVVYPTEGFYYFVTHVEGREVWGNIRVADLDRGKLTFAYFTVPDHQTRFLDLTEDDGLTVARVSAFVYDVCYHGRSVRFELSDCADRPPRQLQTLPEEEFVGQVHDESGVKFFLYFNHDTDSFYYLLNEEDGSTDPLAPLADTLLIGRRTGFVFVADEEFSRKLLVGVALKNIMANNYFDGPGDQVPFRAQLRDKLAAAYPNTRLGAGVDEHGVFLGKSEWMRVAIAPYVRYQHPEDVIAHVRAVRPGLAPGVRWTRLTKEWWNTPAYRRQIEALLAAEGKGLFSASDNRLGVPQ